MVEYALLIIAIMFLAAVAYRNLGKAVRKNADEASVELLKNHRARVLTAEEPAQTRRLLADAYDDFAWRAAA